MTIRLPIYHPQTTSAAWQLNWSLTVFWQMAPFSEDWLDDLQTSLEPDGIRLLEHRFSQPDHSLFLLSTTPSISPTLVIQRVKGRLQNLVRARWPSALRRNYDLQTIGSTRRDKAEQYVASQLQHHYPDDPEQRAALFDMQIMNPDVDLSQPRFTAHGRYRCNLHLVLVHADRWRQTQAAMHERVRVMIRRAAESKGHLLSRLGLLPDHLHLVLGFSPDESPEEIALSYMNNIAFVYDMEPIFQPSYYIGTIGEYDLGAIREHH